MTLNMKFMAEVGTKQELTQMHYRFLAQKIFGDNDSYDDVKDRMVSWTQFNKVMTVECLCYHLHCNK